ncbi:MAG: hypothetical protein ABI748_02805, partial [Dokdonella sp.]
ARSRTRRQCELDRGTHTLCRAWRQRVPRNKPRSEPALWDGPSARSWRPTPFGTRIECIEFVREFASFAAPRDAGRKVSDDILEPGFDRSIGIAACAAAIKTACETRGESFLTEAPAARAAVANSCGDENQLRRTD